MIKRKLIRSKALVNKLGHETGNYNWTECYYLFGMLIKSTQIKNVDYAEILEIFGSAYHKSILSTYHEHEKLWYKSISYNQ